MLCFPGAACPLRRDRAAVGGAVPAYGADSLVPQGIEDPWKAAGQVAGNADLIFHSSAEPQRMSAGQAFACIPQQRYRSPRHRFEVLLKVLWPCVAKRSCRGFNHREWKIEMDCLKRGIDRAALQTFCFDLSSSNPSQIGSKCQSFLSRASHKVNLVALLLVLVGQVCHKHHCR